MFRHAEKTDDAGAGSAVRISDFCTLTILRFSITDQREMPHRRHRTALGENNAAMSGRPIHQPRPWKFGPPAKPSGERRES
jgi:hypothetical protein